MKVTLRKSRFNPIKVNLKQINQFDQLNMPKFQIREPKYSKFFENFINSNFTFDFYFDFKGSCT